MSTNLLEPKKSKRKRISLMMDWVFKYVFYDLEDPSILVSFLMAVDPSFKKLDSFPTRNGLSIRILKQSVMIFGELSMKKFTLIWKFNKKEI